MYETATCNKTTSVYIYSGMTINACNDAKKMPTVTPAKMTT